MILPYFKNRKLVIALLSVLLILCVTVGATLASMSGVTREEGNVFTPAKNIRAKLTEPNWDEKEGLKLVPGKTVRKDPMITNTCEISEYVAIRLTFFREDGSAISGADLRKLLDLLVIDWNPDWIPCDGNKDASPALQPFVFYYKESLEPGMVTPALFSSIRVKDKSDHLTEAQLRWLQGIKIVDGEIVADPDGIGSFRIEVEGAAVQTVDFTGAADAAGALQALLSNG